MLHGCVKGVSRSAGAAGYSHRQIDLIGPPVPLLEPRSHAPPERRKILHFAKTAACEAGTGPASFRSAEVYGVPATTAAGVALTPTAGLPAEQQPPASVTSSPGFDDWWQQLQNQRFSSP